MNELSADRAVEMAHRFMDRVRERVGAARSFLEPASGRRISGRPVEEEPAVRRFEEELRRAFEAEGVWNDTLHARMPRGRRAVWAVRAGSIFHRRTALVVTAAVVHPIRALIRGLSAAPLPPADAVRILPCGRDEAAPVVAAVLSTSGWRPDEETGWPERTSVYLVEPAPGDGFRLAAGPTDRLPGYLAPEDDDELVARVGRYVREARAELVLRGLYAGRTAVRTGAPLALVRKAFARAAKEDEFLRLAEEGGATVLRRT